MEVPVAVTPLVAMTGLEVLMGVTMVTVKVTVLASLAATGALGIWLRWWWIMRGRWKMDWGWMWSSASGDGGGCGSVGSSKRYVLAQKCPGIWPHFPVRVPG